MFNVSICTLLAVSSKYIDFPYFLNLIQKKIQHELLGCVDQCVLQMFMFISFTKFRISI